MDHSNDTDGLGAAFAFPAAIPFILGVLVWIALAVVAAMSPQRTDALRCAC
jgi:hypothetical protein